MGCAMQDIMETTPASGCDASETTATVAGNVGAIGGTAISEDASKMVKLKQASQQLKEQHSALVRLLESAPIKTTATTTTTQQQQQQLASHLKQRKQLSVIPRSSTFAKTEAAIAVGINPADVQNISSGAVLLPNGTDVEMGYGISSDPETTIPPSPGPVSLTPPPKTMIFRKRLKCDQKFLKTFNYPIGKLKTGNQSGIDDDDIDLDECDVDVSKGDLHILNNINHNCNNVINKTESDCDDVKEDIDSDGNNDRSTSNSNSCPWKKIRYARELKRNKELLIDNSCNKNQIVSNCNVNNEQETINKKFCSTIDNIMEYDEDLSTKFLPDLNCDINNVKDEDKVEKIKHNHHHHHHHHPLKHKLKTKHQQHHTQQHQHQQQQQNQRRRDSSDSNSSVLSNSSSINNDCYCHSHLQIQQQHNHHQQQNPNHQQQQDLSENCDCHCDDSGCDGESDDNNLSCNCSNSFNHHSKNHCNNSSDGHRSNNDNNCSNKDSIATTNSCSQNSDKTHQICVADLCQKFNENLSNDSGNGFFRRSIQQKIQYRPCTKNQQCSILRINRNRCQYCRLKKCIAVGMSRDAVRFGRVPKREKARILAAMQQSTQNRGQQRALATELDDQPHLLAAVLRAHMETCEFTKDKVTAMRQRARECPSYSMPTLLACPLNPAPELQSEQEFSQRFAHVIRGVIDFAGMIPGFQLLTQDDKFTLLKAGLFDALFVRLICMFDSSINSIICLNGQVMRRDAIQNGANARFLVDSTFNFAERMNSMNLTDTEIGLFCAIVLITPDRPGLRNIELIEKMYSRLKACLQTVITQNRPDQPEFMSELLKTLPDLRTLSTLHTEKLVVFRTEHKELLRQQMWSMDDDQPSKSPGSSTWDNNAMEDIAKSPMGSVSSTESGDLEYSQSSLASSAPLLAATLSGACPLRHRANSGSSAEDIDIVGSHAHLTQNGLTITPVARTHPHAHLASRYRKLDSPTDSGIESGNEKAESTKTVSSGGGSSCSSPRSSVDDVLDEHATNSHAQTNGSKRQIVEDMPVLKRVLQAPPLYDTNSLMDEAYKPHKKFRALRHREVDTTEPEPNVQPTAVQIMSVRQPSPVQQQQSQLHMHLTRNTGSNNSDRSSSNGHHHHHHNQHSTLSSTHSVLAKSLMEEPRMTPEQMKRTDIIQNYIMRDQPQNNGLLVCASPGQHCPYTTTSPASSSSSSNSNCSSPSTTTVTIASPPPPHALRWQGHSVITTTTLRQQTPSPSSIVAGSSSSTPSTTPNGYFQSPHSTSVSPPRPSPSAQSPRLLELQVDIADSQQPLNLSKKSPTPPPPPHQATAGSKSLARSVASFPVAADVTVTAAAASSPGLGGPVTVPAVPSPSLHKVLLEA